MAFAAPLSDIVGGGHAINVRLSAEEIGTCIASGDIGGVVEIDGDGNEELIVGLGDLNDSGYVGIVWLGAMGEQTEVVVTLVAAPERKDRRRSRTRIGHWIIPGAVAVSCVLRDDAADRADPEPSAPSARCARRLGTGQRSGPRTILGRGGRAHGLGGLG